MVQGRAIECFCATIKSRRIRRQRHVARTVRDEEAYSVLFQKPEMEEVAFKTWQYKSVILKCILSAFKWNGVVGNACMWLKTAICDDYFWSNLLNTRSDVLGVISTNTAVFSYVTSNNPVKIYQFCYAEGEDNSLLRTVAQFVAGYTALQPRKR